MDGSKARAADCRFLLACLVALLFLFPFLADIARPLVLVLFMAAVFLAGVIVADGGREHVRCGFLLAIAQVAFTILSLLARERSRLYVVAVAFALLFTVALILLAAWCILRYVLRARIITRDQIYAGICMYVMIGFAFGAVYYLIDILDPESFAANVSTLGDTPDLLYFSFVTLATLGYGDITPRSNFARALAILESMAGMVYIAVFMARLVSMRSSPGESK